MLLFPGLNNCYHLLLSPNRSLALAKVGGVFSHITNLLYTKFIPKRLLFPPTARVANISNSFHGPRLCAADDLEFSYDTEQIDLFYNQYAQRSATQSHECTNNSGAYDFYNGSAQVEYSESHPGTYGSAGSMNPTGTAHGSGAGVGGAITIAGGATTTTVNVQYASAPNVGSINGNGNGNSNGNINSSGNGSGASGYDFGYDSALDFSYHNLPGSQPYALAPQTLPAKVETHYQWNMNNSGMEYHFNDFQKNYININDNKHGAGNYAALMSTNSSSLQSSDISPLDDEFFKKMNTKKDPTANMMELVDQLFHNYLTKSDNDYQFGPSNAYVQNNSLEQRDSVVSESSVGSIEQFDGSIETPFHLDSNIEPPYPLAQRNNSLNPRPVKREREDDDDLMFRSIKREKDEEDAFNSNNNGIEDIKPIRYQTVGPKRRKSRKPKPDSYDCPHCDAKFKVKGYLTRHVKKHNSAKAFTCPFYQDDAAEGDYSSENTPTSHMSNIMLRNPVSGGIVGTKCHPTGGFTRRDTFKTHLKALHFIYPPGTKLSERNMIEGRCAGCFQHFKNNAEWLETHIERGECQGSVRSINGLHDRHSKEHSHDQHHFVQL